MSGSARAVSSVGGRMAEWRTTLGAPPTKLGAGGETRVAGDHGAAAIDQDWGIKPERLNAVPGAKRWFALDSLLEEAGFEPSVPLCPHPGLIASFVGDRGS